MKAVEGKITMLGDRLFREYTVIEIGDHVLQNMHISYSLGHI